MVPVSVACLGAVDRAIAMLDALLGRHDDAVARYEDALALERHLASPPLVARTQVAYARCLAARDGPGDRERARELATAALEVARRLGMRVVAKQAEALLAGS